MAISNESLLIRNSLNNTRAIHFNGGTLEWRTGAIPASADAVATGTLLATNTCAATSFGASLNGIITYAADTPNPQVGLGDIGYMRALTSGGATIADYDVGLAASGASVIVDKISVLASEQVNITSFTLTQG